MPNPPSVDLAAARFPLSGTARPIEQFTVKELKDELIRRKHTDFSKWEVWIKLSPFILLCAMGILWKLGETVNYLRCLAP